MSLRGLSDKRVYFINLQSAVTEGKSIMLEWKIKKLDNYAVTNIDIYQGNKTI
jgi:Ni2+-binding GTPase involved in maturation of urease and hydrogenase